MGFVTIEWRAYWSNNVSLNGLGICQPFLLYTLKESIAGFILGLAFKMSLGKVLMGGGVIHQVISQSILSLCYVLEIQS